MTSYSCHQVALSQPAPPEEKNEASVTRPKHLPTQQQRASRLAFRRPAPEERGQSPACVFLNDLSGQLLVDVLIDDLVDGWELNLSRTKDAVVEFG